MARGPPTGRQKTAALGHTAEGRSATAEQRCKLVLLAGPNKGKAFELPNDQEGPLRIGKADDNELVLDADTVSRYHCQLTLEGGRWLVEDLKSTNGTFIDQARIKQAYLRQGSTLRLGGVVLQFASTLAPLAMAPSPRESFGSLVGKSVKMREIFSLLERVSPTSSTILIVGDTGTGKGALARAVHEASPRAHGPLVVVDAGAVAPALIESELFGHEKGAFTGAEARRIGALEQANGGTLFLDELDDLRKDLQPKLLRALEERVLQRVGSSETVPFDARVVAASKKDLRTMVAQGTFREDLYFRIAVFRIELPPLGERAEDLPVLFDRFAESLGRHGAWSQLPKVVRDRLSIHSWPGNVRELRNAIERAFTLAAEGSPPAELWQLEAPFEQGASDERSFDLPFKVAKERLVDAFEKEYIRRLLIGFEGRVTAAARAAGLDRKHLYNLLNKHGMRVQGEDEEGG